MPCFELTSAGLSSFSSREFTEEISGPYECWERLLFMLSQPQQTTCRKSDVVSFGVHDLRGTENYLAQNNHR